MKRLILAALAVTAALCLHAQEKPAPQAPPNVIKRTDMTEAEQAQFAALMEAKARMDAEIELVKLQKSMPLIARKNELVQRVCTRLGVPKEKIATECRPDIDPAKGKEHFGEIRWEQAPPKEPAAAKEPAKEEDAK